MLNLKVIAGAGLIIAALSGVVYIQHLRFKVLEQSTADLKTSLTDLQEQVQAGETARLNLAKRLNVVETRRQTAQTVLQQVPVNVEKESVVSDVLKEALRGAAR